MIVEDTTAPSITVLNSNPYTIEASTNEYIDLQTSVYDLSDPNVSVEVDTSAINVSRVGTYSVVYTATDKFNNISTTYRNVLVVDNTPPVISFIKNPHTINLTKDLSIQEYTIW